MDAELALKYVQMKHPPAWPNEGFRYQLKLFEGVHAMPWKALATFPLSGTFFRNHSMFFPQKPEAQNLCLPVAPELVLNIAQQSCLEYFVFLSKQIWVASWIRSTRPTSTSCSAR